MGIVDVEKAWILGKMKALIVSPGLDPYYQPFAWITYSWAKCYIPNNIKRSYSLIQYKGYNSKFKFFDDLEFRKYFISLPAFQLIIWLMKSPKNFEKTSILKI